MGGKGAPGFSVLFFSENPLGWREARGGMGGGFRLVYVKIRGGGGGHEGFFAIVCV